MRITTMGGNPMHLVGTEVKVGDKAPDVRLCLGDFSEFKLSDHFGKKIVLTIFPSIDTSVCALQTKRFNQEADKLDDVVVITVSKDLSPALSRYCAAEGIHNLITASDYKYNDFGDKYGFLIDEMKILGRGNVVIGKDGVIELVEYVSELRDEPNYDAVLEILKNN